MIAHSCDDIRREAGVVAGRNFLVPENARSAWTFMFKGKCLSRVESTHGIHIVPNVMQKLPTVMADDAAILSTFARLNDRELRWTSFACW